jgi:hypothetical protein
MMCAWQMRVKQSVLALFALGALVGCGELPPTLLKSVGTILAQNKVHLQQVRIVFLNRLPSGTTVPLVSSALKTLRFNTAFSLDGSALASDKPLEQNLPFIQSGEHLLELELKKLKEPVRIPLVVPEKTRDTPLNILVVLAFNSEGDQIRTIQVGYDQNQDGELDPQLDIYRSNNGKTYLLYLPDGSVQEWRSQILNEEGNPVISPSEKAPIPPGTDKLQPVGSEPDRPLPQGGPEKPSGPTIEVPLPPLPQPLPLPVPPAP